MSATAVERTSLGDANLNLWGLDVNTGTKDSPTWLPVRGIHDFKPNLDAKSIDVSDFEAGMWEDSQPSTKGWSVDFKCWRKVNPAAAESGGPQYDAGQEYLRLHDGGSVEIRFFELGGDGTTATGMPRVEAYQGRASVKWSPDGGKHTDAMSVSCTLGGKGVRRAIAHPMPNK